MVLKRKLRMAKKSGVSPLPRVIKVVGAREHNLKNITVSIPKDTLTVITGPSGSGKSSLALDVLYTEGKRRYMESLSSYARQFLGIVKKPEVDHIDGLCPSIAIEQKTIGSNPRSTVGTTTEIYDYMRVLFARIGKIHCPSCHSPISAESTEQIVSLIIAQYEGNTISINAPIAIAKKGEFVQELTRLYHKGLYRFIIDGTLHRFKSDKEIAALSLGKTHKHTIDVQLDRFEVAQKECSRLFEAVTRAYELAQGVCKIVVGDKEYIYSAHRTCMKCGISVPELEPRHFSFNSPLGACTRCSGLGIVHEWPWKSGDKDSWKADYPDFFGDKYATIRTCGSCNGTRLNPQALAVTIGGSTIHDISTLAIGNLITFFTQLKLASFEQTVGQGLINEIVARLTFLKDVGLAYLSLGRSVRTLSGGEGQRIRLATQIGAALSGVLYVLDEPSIGLHQRDNDRLIATLHALRDQGNTVVVVEHDTDTMRASDFIIDMGPASGVHGGQVMAVGTPDQIERNPASLTGAYLSGKRSIALPAKTRVAQGALHLTHATMHNLKDVSVSFPLRVMCGISGVSGSGKSTLIMQELVPAVRHALGETVSQGKSNAQLEGAEQLSHLIVIDQSPIGRSSRSNPATYLGVFDDIRRLFASLPESNARGYKVGNFSFNVPAGQCTRCKGEGSITVEMHFLPEVVTPCSSCKGARYHAQVLEIQYKGKNIAQVLQMTAQEALEFFSAHHTIVKRLQLLCDVGLGYLTLGQPSTTLSGGEAQRIKLVDELAKRGTDTLYILDEPTTGLHSVDIERLLVVLNRLVDKGNSMIIIEHNLELLKTVDHLIDLGPEGGQEGGTIVAQGAPRDIAYHSDSHTAKYLATFFKKK